MYNIILIINQEWIKEKIKKGDINYFDYNEFNNIEKIDKGGFGIVSKATTNDGMQVALKSFINKKGSGIEENIIKNFIKEVKYYLNLL